MAEVTRVMLPAVLCAAMLAGCSAAQNAGTAGTQASAQAASAAASSESEDRETAQIKEPAAAYRTVAPAQAQVNIVTAEDEDIYTQALASRLKQYLISNQFSEENIGETQAENNDILQQVREKTEADSNLLIVDCAEEENAPEITDAAVSAGVPLIYIGTEPSDDEQARWKENEWKVTYIGTDESETAQIRSGILEKLSADSADANENGKIDYIALSAQDSGDDKDDEADSSVNEETVSALAEADIESNCLEETASQSDRDTVKTQVEGLIDSYGEDIEVILCSDDTIALGAADAVEEYRSKIGHDVYVIGTAATEDSLEEVRTGGMFGTVAEDILLQAQYAADAARSFVQGEAADEQYLAPGVAVTVDNAQEILDVLAVDEN